MNNELMTFNYKAPAGRMLLITLISISMSVFLSYLALTSIKGVRIFGAIKLSPENSILLFWALSAATLVVALIVFVSTLLNSKGSRQIVLDSNHAILPKASISGKLIQIPYTSIKHTSLQTVSGHNFYVVKSNEGNSTIYTKSFENPLDFVTFQQAF